VKVRPIALPYAVREFPRHFVRRARCRLQVIERKWQNIEGIGTDGQHLRQYLFEIGRGG
jgi:hypothetical protein